MPNICNDATCQCDDKSQFLIKQYFDSLACDAFSLTSDDTNNSVDSSSKSLGVNLTPKVSSTAVSSSDKSKVRTGYQLPHSLVVLCCYLSTTALALYCLQPALNTGLFFLLLCLSVGSYLYHALYLSGLGAGLSGLNAYLSKKKAGLLVSLALRLTCLTEYASKLIILLVHIGFESALSLHGAYTKSCNLLVTGIMAISHGLIELLAEYGSFFHAKSILDLPKKASIITIKPFFIGYGSFFSRFAYVGFFGFAYGALVHLVSASSPAIVSICTIIFSCMAAVYARVYVANIQTYIKDQVDHGVVFSYKHALVACLSLISATALYFEYFAHGMVLMSDVAGLLNSCVCSIFGASASVYTRLLINTIVSPGLLHTVMVGFIVLSSASAALMWSWVMYGAATRQEGCASCSEDVRLPSYYLHITALVGGLVAAIELHDFLDAFTVANLPLVPMMVLSAVSAYLVEYAFFAGDDSQNHASLTLDIAKSIPMSSTSLARSTSYKKNNVVDYVPEFFSTILNPSSMFKK